MLKWGQILFKYINYAGKNKIPERKSWYDLGEENRCWGNSNFHCNLPDISVII